MFSLKQTVYFGTYTKKNSNGIYRATLDTEKQELSQPKNIITIGNPTYLRLTNDQSLISVATEGPLGGIANYYLPDNAFDLLADPLSNGSSPCYIGLDLERRLVFAAYYHRATVEVYRLNSDQTLTLTDTIKHSGSGPRPEQESAHIHFADLTPDHRLAVIDLGNDTLTTYDISADGKLTLKNTLNFEKGFGPRHLVFAPNGEYAYLVGELSSQVATLKYDSENGSFSILQVQKTIPDDFKEHNGAAAIRISKDDQHVYVSNRGHNTLALFDVTSNHQLQFIEYTSTKGDFPRDFAIDSTSKYLIVANQNTDNATLFTVDEQSGKLDCIQKDIPLPEGVCVCFANN